VGELIQKCEGLVERLFKLGAMGFVALCISFIAAAPIIAGEPSAAELRAIVSTWRNVKGIINGLRVVPDEVRRRASELPISKVNGLTYGETLEVIELIYVTSKRTTLPRFAADPRLPGPNEMRNPFLRDNTGRVDVPVLPPDPRWESTFLSEPDRTKSILSMTRKGDAVSVDMGDRGNYICGVGKSTVECRKRNGRWVITDISGW